MTSKRTSLHLVSIVVESDLSCAELQAEIEQELVDGNPRIDVPALEVNHLGLPPYVRSNLRVLAHVKGLETPKAVELFV